MRKYKQITQEQRYEISGYLRAGFNESQIAKLLGFNKSTINRELNRNGSISYYDPEKAQKKAEHRRKTALKSVRFTEEMVRREQEHEEAEERYKENKKEKDKEKKVMHRIDVPHIFKHIIEFEEKEVVVKNTLKKHNIEYEFEDGKFIFRKSQELRLKETNLKYKVVGSIYEETTEEEQLKYNEELKSEKNKQELESGSQDKDLK